MSTTRIYFILSCARSGSTSLARILDTADNGQCLLEPVPNLNVETRDMMEGRLENPRQMLAEQVFPRIAKVLDEGHIYGEKNVTQGPFIPYLYEMLKCKFVYLKRDGRDVATSLMNWHNEVFGSIYREAKEQGILSSIAKKAISLLPIEQDTSDYSRPRPRPNDPFYKEWSNLSRFEMVTWYWAYINRLYLENLANIPQEDWITLDYSGVTAQNIETVFDFLGLTGYQEERVTEMLESRINSVEQRTGLRPRFPRWPEWEASRMQQFKRIAQETMDLLEYDL